ncbi:ABC transporter ATP-binding protein [Rhodocyclus tenuis]|uniref:ATP-binding cassette subfamily B protein n=1 Tax=Rhodocyclus tenuis TaxID=1066 RepID=A0A840FZZ7_RHOTE|nr:ABC transporter ATP-binding protein [Rhodocyclus tenuis]MBB4247474.1 ATP-binding cassette subfamily B protein [Rhodocyclus tenuis]
MKTAAKQSRQQTPLTRPQTFLALALRGARPLGWACVAAVGSAALSIAPFWCLYLIALELFAASPDLSEVRYLAFWALGLLAMRWALMAISHVLAHTGAFAVQHRLRLGMAQRMGEVALSFFAGRGSGSLRRTMTDDVINLEGFLAHLLPDAVASATVPLVTLVLLFALDWRLALAALVPLPLAFVAQTVLMRRAARRMREWSELQKRIADQIGEYVRGITVIKSFGSDAQSFGELSLAIHKAVAWVEDYARGSSAGWVLFTGLLSANLVIVAPLGAWLHAGGTLDLPTYILFLLLAPVVLLPLLRLTFALGEQLQRVEALTRINAVLAAPKLAQTGHAAPPQGPLAIEFENVRHSYGDKTSLRGVSFKADACRLTALVGASGSGKSTLIKLVPRLYEYDAGSVRVGGLDVRQWPLDALLERIGIVFQDVFLFHGSVADNLRLAQPDASDAQLEAAARAARAHEFIMALPQGYATPLGERGARLSGGERQRLSIARALLKDAPILLLDEATASVDAENEALIQQALDVLCRDRSVLMIAHRLHTVMHADRIVVMEGGRIVGQGRHAALLRDCPAYQRLWHDHEAARHWSLDVSEAVALTEDHS